MTSQSLDSKRYVVDQSQLPVQFPTHRHSAEFWEQLGRVVATYGFLEEVLGKAIYAFTATRRYSSSEDTKAAYEKWLPQLERALTDQLWNLAEAYGNAVRNNSDSTISDSNVDKLVNDIKKAT